MIRTDVEQKRNINVLAELSRSLAQKDMLRGEVIGIIPHWDEEEGERQGR
jgi:hypothetical protein